MSISFPLIFLHLDRTYPSRYTDIMGNTETLVRDPLGLQALASAVAAVHAAAHAEPPADPESMRGVASRLKTAHSDFSVKMDLLRDRYALLKKTCAQLAEELAWLRDQLDDLRSDEERSGSDATPPAMGSDHRRYTDRWRKGAHRD
jgi:hypothetical protein